MFCLTIAGQPVNKIFHMYRKAPHIDCYITAGQFAMTEVDKKRDSLSICIADIRKKHHQRGSKPTRKFLGTARCKFPAVENGVM